MAKNQNISLNPSRINGMCGRLLCCFRYEDEFYEDMQKRMPKMNSTVTTPDGKGVVSNTDFLRETVTVTFSKNDESTEIKFDVHTQAG
jgi:cell fate regulator YaaT (PSP1 superfamily)